MYPQLVDHLQNNSLFNNEQQGFRRGKSVQAALIEFSESVMDLLDKDKKVLGIFMDLSKAFGSIYHKKLWNKLELLGILKISLNWVTSYLSNRTQYDEIKSGINNKIEKFGILH